MTGVLIRKPIILKLLLKILNIYRVILLVLFLKILLQIVEAIIHLLEIDRQKSFTFRNEEL